jgi:hypothetical protein
MNAAAARVETQVTAEDRIARIESDVAEIKDDVKTINIRLNDSIVANARELGAVRAEIATHRTDTEKGFGALRTDTERNFGAVRTDTEKRFGTLQVAIESNKTETEKGFGSLRLEIEKTKLWLLSTAIGTVVTILGGTVYLHTLKII